MKNPSLKSSTFEQFFSTIEIEPETDPAVHLQAALTKLRSFMSMPFGYFKIFDVTPSDINDNFLHLLKDRRRQYMRKYHSDLHNGHKSADEFCILIGQIYDTLRDKAKLNAYMAAQQPLPSRQSSQTEPKNNFINPGEFIHSINPKTYDYYSNTNTSFATATEYYKFRTSKKV